LVHLNLEVPLIAFQAYQMNKKQMALSRIHLETMLKQ